MTRPKPAEASTTIRPESSRSCIRAITDNTTPGDGGGISNDGELHLDNVTVCNNEAAYGGGISNLSLATATNATIVNNTATIWGGGTSTDDGTTLTLVNTIVTALKTADTDGPDISGDMATSFNNLVGDDSAAPA